MHPSPHCPPVADTTPPEPAETMTVWETRAQRLLQEAADHVHKDDVLPVISAAETALRISLGEVDRGELDNYPFPGEEAAEICTCPPDLVARGGYRGSCAAHWAERGGDR